MPNKVNWKKGIQSIFKQLQWWNTFKSFTWKTLISFPSKFFSLYQLFPTHIINLKPSPVVYRFEMIMFWIRDVRVRYISRIQKHEPVFWVLFQRFKSFIQTTSPERTISWPKFAKYGELFVDSWVVVRNTHPICVI